MKDLPMAEQKESSVLFSLKELMSLEENRIKEEVQIVEFFKQQGLQVTVPDREAFRKHVQSVYQASDYAKVWPKGLLERINAVK